MPGTPSSSKPEAKPNAFFESPLRLRSWAAADSTDEPALLPQMFSVPDVTFSRMRARSSVFGFLTPSDVHSNRFRCDSMSSKSMKSPSLTHNRTGDRFGPPSSLSRKLGSASH
eukprot:1634858-Pyramimonas_sp.AAC.1